MSYGRLGECPKRARPIPYRSNRRADRQRIASYEDSWSQACPGKPLRAVPVDRRARSREKSVDVESWHPAHLPPARLGVRCTTRHCKRIRCWCTCRKTFTRGCARPRRMQALRACAVRVLRVYRNKEQHCPRATKPSARFLKRFFSPLFAHPSTHGVTTFDAPPCYFSSITLLLSMYRITTFGTIVVTYLDYPHPLRL